MYERIDHRLEQALSAPGVLGDPPDEAGLHDRRLTHHDEEPPADRELLLEALVGYGERGCDGDGVVTRVGIQASRILRHTSTSPKPSEAMLRRASSARSGKISSERTEVPPARRQAVTNPEPVPISSTRSLPVSASACRSLPTTLGRNMCWPQGKGISTSAKARKRCCGETKVSRGTLRRVSSTRASSTSQARTCCSIICSRAWTVDIVIGAPIGLIASQGRGS